jgi:hypothetical protein
MVVVVVAVGAVMLASGMALGSGFWVLALAVSVWGSKSGGTGRRELKGAYV